MNATEKKKKRTIMRRLVIKELSAVDKPAQEPAEALLMKRADATDGEDTVEPDTVRTTGALEPDKIGKRAALTTAQAGHSHVVTLDYGQGDLSHGNTDMSRGPGEDSNYHSHPWVRTEDGEIVIGEADGHTHGIGEMSKSQPTHGATNMDPTKKKAKEGQDTDIEKMNARLERAEAIAALTGTQKSHYDALETDAEKDSFLQKSAEERDAEVEKAADIAKRDVVYTDLDGHDYTKRDDPRLISNAKRADQAVRDAAKNAAIAKRADLEKRAGTVLKNYPKDTDVHVAVLGAVDGIKDDETRKSAIELLKAGSDALGGAFNRKGTKTEKKDATDDPTLADENGLDAFDKRADEIMKELAKSGEKITFEQAYEKALEEDPKAYAESIGLVEVSAEEAAAHYE